MSTAGEVAKTFTAGVVTAGIATAVLLPGRLTIGAVKATGDAASGVLGTAIKG